MYINYKTSYTCQTNLSSHDIIGFINSSRGFSWSYGMSFFINSRLILLIRATLKFY
jgi:hypothetical protein